MPWWRWRRIWKKRSKAMERGELYRCLWPITNFNTRLQSKSPINPVAGLWGFYSLLLTRLLSHSVKIGHIPIYIGIKFNFVLCELDVRRILSSHNELLWWKNKNKVCTTSFIFVNLIGSLLSLEILIDRLVTKLPYYEKGKSLDCNPTWWGDNA